MIILITERPTDNGYIESLISAYSRANNTVVCDVSNFFYSNYLPDILHIHWPESLYKWYSVGAVNEVDIREVIEERLLWYKQNGVRIVHTIHNVLPHDTKKALDKDIFQVIIKYSDILIHHCSESVNLIRGIYPNVSEKLNIVCPHGDYLIHYKKVDQSVARQRYGIPPDRTVILNFGKQRAYKNEKFIEVVFNRLGIDSKYLTIAGQFEMPVNDLPGKLYFQARNKVRGRVKFNNKKYIYRHFPISEIPYIISSADIVFLAQQHGLNSGLLSLAATYGKSVVCPDVGCFRASLSDWCHETYEAGNVQDATNALQKMCAIAMEAKRQARYHDNAAWLVNHSWDGHVQKIVDNIEQKASNI